MIIQFDSDIVKKIKLGVLIRKNFKDALIIFAKDPYTPRLDNHPLKKNWYGYRSIDVNADYRVFYKEIKAAREITVYFVAIGTHKELYTTRK